MLDTERESDVPSRLLLVGRKLMTRKQQQEEGSTDTVVSDYQICMNKPAKRLGIKSDTLLLSSLSEKCPAAWTETSYWSIEEDLPSAEQLLSSLSPPPGKLQTLLNGIIFLESFDFQCFVTAQMMFGGKTRYKRCDIVNSLRIFMLHNRTQTIGPLFYTNNADSAAEKTQDNNPTLKQGSRTSCVDATADTPIGIYGYMVFLLCLSYAVKIKDTHAKVYQSQYSQTCMVESKGHTQCTHAMGICFLIIISLS